MSTNVQLETINPQYLSPDSLLVNQQIGPVHICSTLNWHPIYLCQPLRTYQHHSTSLLLVFPSTSAHILHPSTCGPATPFQPVPLHFNHHLSSFQHHHLFFKVALVSPLCVGFPSPSLYLCLQPFCPFPCYFSAPSVCTDMMYHLPVQHAFKHICFCLQVCVYVCVPGLWGNTKV